MASTSDISRGLIIKLENSLYKVIEFGENKTARSAAKVWAKLKGVDNNRTIEQTWNSGETIYPVRVERKEYQFFIKTIRATTLWTTKPLSRWRFRKPW
jgi:elongation factor P